MRFPHQCPDEFDVKDYGKQKLMSGASVRMTTISNKPVSSHGSSLCNSILNASSSLYGSAQNFAVNASPGLPCLRWAPGLPKLYVDGDHIM